MYGPYGRYGRYGRGGEVPGHLVGLVEALQDTLALAPGDVRERPETSGVERARVAARTF